MIISNLCYGVSECRATLRRCSQSACRGCRVTLELVVAGRMLLPRPPDVMLTVHEGLEAALLSGGHREHKSTEEGARQS